MKKIVLEILIIGLILSLVVGCFDRNKAIDFNNVPKEYKPDAAIKNGDVVDVHGKMTNMEKLDGFVENFNKKQTDKIRITRYTTEGDPILYTLVYNGKTIEYTIDTSRDKFGGMDKGVRKFEYSKILIDGMSYFLVNDKGEKTEVITVRR